MFRMSRVDKGEDRVKLTTLKYSSNRTDLRDRSNTLAKLKACLLFIYVSTLSNDNTKAYGR